MLWSVALKLEGEFVCVCVYVFVYVFVCVCACVLWFYIVSGIEVTAVLVVTHTLYK